MSTRLKVGDPPPCPSLHTRYTPSCPSGAEEGTVRPMKLTKGSGDGTSPRCHCTHLALQRQQGEWVEGGEEAAGPPSHGLSPAPLLTQLHLNLGKSCGPGLPWG